MGCCCGDDNGQAGNLRVGPAPQGQAQGNCGQAPPPPPVNPVRIRVQVPPTDSVRGTDVTNFPVPNNIAFETNSGAQDLGANPPLVVVRNTSDLLVEIETNPANQADRINLNITAESGTLNAVPAFNVGAGTLETNSCGHFQVSATSADGATVIYLNLIIVDVVVTNPVVNTFNQAVIFSATAREATCKLYDTRMGPAPQYADVGTFSIEAQADIQLVVDGNPALAAYCDGIHMGWTNNLHRTNGGVTVDATYDGGRRVVERVPVPQPALRRGQTIDSAVTPIVDLGIPTLDRGLNRADNGGDTVFLNWNQEVPNTGDRRTISNKDKPNVTFPIRHPASNTSFIRRVRGSIDFKLFLLAYSNDAPFSFVAFGHLDWTLQYNCDFALTSFNYRMGQSAANTGQLGATDNGSTVNATVFQGIPHGQEARAAGCELRPPVYQNLVLDYN